MASTYITRRRALCRTLVEHCRAQAMDAISPKTAAQWIALMDAVLWLSDPEGDIGAVERLATSFARAKGGDA